MNNLNSSNLITPDDSAFLRRQPTLGSCPLSATKLSDGCECAVYAFSSQLRRVADNRGVWVGAGRRAGAVHLSAEDGCEWDQERGG